MGAFVCFARRQTMYASLALMLTTLCSISFSIPPLWKRIDCSCVSIETRGFASEVRKKQAPDTIIQSIWRKTLFYYIVENIGVLSLLIVDDIECSFRDWILPIPVKSDFLKVFWPGPDMLMVDQGPSW